ncbi:DUF1642 domain-containing protein [Listeria seeligeri]|uniref:DUF1642 domain-containing protein n=1 Tax=Listeria seeligeri TaxID=1640 RepID=UPI0010789677|nr:DUF1642 domain-containing protein [Listeria seeligeri]EAA0364376.1 DUF1642 domain-containing protein [Listeria monocytogenes]EAC6107001.1 DUF1642 domain-containing protein [Listeria monocytogenes]EAD3084228.1 DUF1642 domain-containing protein [Listeria monocytogenes]EAD3088101.1 DUF1642 domain-containing protein [Listeria monocytogenes]EAD3091420.1 DUF1642 domain-containing protein [Listeria monocytogenes]
MKKITTDYVKGTKNYAQITDDAAPLVPEFVAKWFEENKRDLEVSIWRYIYNFDAHEEEPTDFYDFMNSYDNKPIETLIMMQYGYYVEKEVEQLYVVKIPQAVVHYDYFLTKLEGEIDITCRDVFPRRSEYHLTEAEIRSVWDGYMELAEEVE